MAGDKTYITDDQGKMHRATRVYAVTPEDIVWSNNRNDYSVQVRIDGKWHRAILTYDVSADSYFDNVNIDKALVTGADGKQHTALIVKPESTVTLSDIKTDTHGTIAGTTTGETAVSTYSENWSDVKWQDNVNVYKVLVTGSDGKVHTALLTTSAGGGVQVIVLGTSPLLLPDAIADSLTYVRAFGGTEQNGTPIPNTPVDIVTNNGALKYSPNELDPSDIEIGYYRVSGTGGLTESPYNFITGYMPVKPDQSYVFFGRRQDDNRLSSYNRIHWFDVNKQFISTNSYNINQVGTGVAPSNAYFAQCSCNESGSTSRVTTQEIVDGYNWVFQPGSAEVPYIPYVEGGFYTDGTVETINAHGKNLLDMAADNIVLGKYINNSGTVADSGPNFYNSKYIPVAAGETYTWSTSSSVGYFSVMEYDSDYTFKNRTLFGSSSLPAGTAGTITLRNDTAFVLIGSNIDSTDVTLDSVAAISWQFEKGSTATDYQPYYDGGTATAEMLLKVGNYQDEQEILSGVVTRNVGIKVLDGTENFEIATATNCYSLTNTLGTGNFANRTIVCSHFASTPTLPGTGDRQGLAFITNKGPEYTIAFGATTQFSTQALWKQWLADQYAAGTPVIVIYPLATPTTESVTGQHLQVQAGDNTLEITQASLTGLELEAEYTKTE